MLFIVLDSIICEEFMSTILRVPAVTIEGAADSAGKISVGTTIELDFGSIVDTSVVTRLSIALAKKKGTYTATVLPAQANIVIVTRTG